MAEVLKLAAHGFGKDVKHLSCCAHPERHTSQDHTFGNVHTIWYVEVESRKETDVSDVIPTNSEQRPQTRGRTTNGFAVASLVLGIVWAMGVGSILALVFGYIAKSQIDRSPDEETGRGMAIAGIVLGWVGVGFLVLMIVSAWTGWMGMNMMGGDMMEGVGHGH